jgi:hypothetical protein
VYRAIALQDHMAAEKLGKANFGSRDEYAE